MLLVFLCVPALLVSCNTSEQGGAGLDSSLGEITDNADIATLPETTIPLLPSKDFKGADYTILVSAHTGGNKFNDFAYDEKAGTILDDAIYRRNEAVGQKYSVNVVTIEDFADTPAAPVLINRNHSAGDNKYDAAVVLAYDVSVLAYDGKLSNLNSLPFVDLKNPWWDQKANEDLSIRDLIFYTLGDYAIFANRMTSCVLFNKKIAREKELGNYYEMVLNGTWTFDILSNDAKKVSEDLNGDGKIDYTDRYGLHTWNDAIYAMVNAAGCKCCTINDDGEIVLTLGGERVYSVIEKYMGLYDSSEYVVNFQVDPIYDDYESFRQGHALFSMTLLKECEEARASETEFGVLPYPKFDGEQEEYYNSVAPWHINFICVPAAVADEDFSGFVLEALCRESATTIVPAYYDKTLVGNGVRDDESIEMLDVIFSTRCFDVGYFYQPANINKQLILQVVQTRNPNFAPIYAAYESAANAAILKINTYFANVVDLNTD